MCLAFQSVIWRRALLMGSAYKSYLCHDLCKQRCIEVIVEQPRLHGSVKNISKLFPFTIMAFIGMKYWRNQSLPPFQQLSVFTQPPFLHFLQMFSVVIHSHCIKVKMYKFRIPRKKSALGIFLSFKFKGRAIWHSPGSFRVNLDCETVAILRLF